MKKTLIITVISLIFLYANVAYCKDDKDYSSSKQNRTLSTNKARCKNNDKDCSCSKKNGKLSVNTSQCKNDEGCSCNEQNQTLSEAIQSELKDVFNPESGFAAGETSFINNLPNFPDTVNVVSNSDLTLTQAPNLPPSTNIEGLKPLPNASGGNPKSK